MFYSISWSSYFTTVCLLLILYYVFVGWKYFKWELLAMVGIHRTEESRISASLLPVNADDTPDVNDGQDISLVVQSFADEVAAFAEGVVPDERSKPQVFNSLSSLVAKYSVLASPENMPIRNDIIRQELNKRTAGFISEDELSKL